MLTKKSLNSLAISNSPEIKSPLLDLNVNGRLFFPLPLFKMSLIVLQVFLNYLNIY